MNSGLRLPILLAIVVATSLLAFSRQIRVDYDHHINFGQYKTYSWAKVETPNSIWDERVKEAIDKVLQSKGWMLVPAGGDVSVVAVGTTHEKRTLHTFYDSFDGWLWGGFADATTYEDTYEVGTLIVDMFDATTKKLIWRGSASDVLSSKPDKNIKELEKAVDKMFEHFPPRAAEQSSLVRSTALFIR
jgi:uncharacterized protein DUF4136